MILEEIRQISLKHKFFVHKTPVLTSSALNTMTGYKIHLKCENFQRMGAFKFRGAFNAMNNLSEKEKAQGVVTHSSGNHAQAVALAGKILRVKTIIVMPDNAPVVKIDATRDYGAEIVFTEPSETARKKTTKQLIDENNFTFIHPYDNINVIKGAGTACLELLEEVGVLDAVIAPVGGGGLISGTGIVAKESKLIKHAYGAEPKNADDAYQSFKSGTIVIQTNPNTIADGLRTSLSDLTFGFIQKYLDDIFTVSEQEILKAMQLLWERMKIIVEPSGAVPIAALISKTCPIKKGSKIGVILSGGNADLKDYFQNYQIEK